MCQWNIFEKLQLYWPVWWLAHVTFPAIRYPGVPDTVDLHVHVHVRSGLRVSHGDKHRTGSDDCARRHVTRVTRSGDVISHVDYQHGRRGLRLCVCVCYNGCEPVHACSSWRAQCWLLSTIARWWTTDVHLSGICRHCLLALSLFLSLAVSVFVRLAHRLKFTLAWFAKASISGPWCWSPPSSRSVSL